MSEHQQKQAVRVASVPTKEFEAAIEAENPATVTKLAATRRMIADAPSVADDLRISIDRH
jgi:hypothetical protein